jgi:hypothetical protein
MRFFSFTVLFRMAVSATLPLGSFNRLSLHVMGLSPNNRAQNVHNTFAPTTPAVAAAAAGEGDTLTTSASSFDSLQTSLDSATSEKEVCASPSSRNTHAAFPSLATVFDCRGGHSMHPMEDAAQKAPSIPLSIFGVELSLFGLKLLLQMGLTLLNVACWWIPMQTKSFSQNDNLMALANTFSTGKVYLLCCRLNVFRLVFCLHDIIIFYLMRALSCNE